jgi:signal transduction histidine kinase
VTSDPSRGSTHRHSLKRELLLNIALIAGAAISLAVVTALVGQLFRPGFAVVGIVVLIAADTVVFFLFARYLLRKLVLQPLDALVAVTDELASGNWNARAAPAATEEFTRLGQRFNRMTDRLIEARAELVRAEKLASIGRLATGVAHEVGNPLSAIGTYVDVLRRRGGDPELLSALEREMDRIDRIVRGLLAYARPRDDALGDVDVAAVMQTVVELLEQQGALTGVELSTAVRPDLPAVWGSVHGLEQVAVNLVLNAVDAAPSGAITIGAEPRRFQSGLASERRRTDPPGDALPERELSPRPKRPEIEDGTQGVLFWVADSGPGVPIEDRERVFDPFYSTKEPGFGTGLGLAIVQGTVHEMGGLVWVDEAREGGANFKVFLPAAPPERRPASNGGERRDR